jgi:hypothetical protein
MPSTATTITVCTVCADLEPEFAFRLMRTERDDIFFHNHDTWGARKIPQPGWTTDKREDLAGWELGTSSHNIQSAAESGCQFCKILLAGLHKYVTTSREEPAVIVFCPGHVLRLRVGAAQNDENSGEPSTELEFYTEEGGPWGNYFGTWYLLFL